MPRRRSGLLAVCVAAPLLLWSANTFVTAPSQGRRQALSDLAVVSLGVVPALNVVQPAFAGDRERAQMVRNARNKYLPRILESYFELKKEGAITDEFAKGTGVKLVKALDLYGSIQRLEETPDKYSRKLQKGAKKVEKAIEKRDYDGVMAALEDYRTNIPGSPGEFIWSTDGF
eukprot:TRINITY_DN83547_c0_g1_i1.p1 TRINITY_DN83547_c0_g1~~TRINITY_DN83547_c0_g1_i1.p1  ORF type:complete len:173 (+),score=43.24 TRINITY_DN83547_c0_g1_i1:62-580(+)